MKMITQFLPLPRHEYFIPMLSLSRPSAVVFVCVHQARIGGEKKLERDIANEHVSQLSWGQEGMKEKKKTKEMCQSGKREKVYKSSKSFAGMSI